VAITVVLTILILVFSEIIPKTIGATYWKQLNAFAAYVIQVLVVVLFPAVWVLEKTTQMLKSEETQPTISRMEIEAMARIGASEGALVEREDRILRNLLHLNMVQVSEVMTPRTVVLAFQQDATVEHVLKNHPTLPYARMPIYNEHIDDVTGFVLRQDLLYAYTAGEHNKPLHALKREIGVVPETNSIASVLDDFIARQQHILLVIDEYGGTAGIITMEDTIETLLGIEITDESDLVADLRQMAQQRFLRQQEFLERMAATNPHEKPDTAPRPSELPGSAD